MLAIQHSRLQANHKSRDVVVLEARVVCGSGGGPDKTILNSPRYLWSAGYTTLCAYMHPPGDAGFQELEQKAVIYGAPIVSVPDRGPWDWRVITRMLNICRRHRVTIWHGHDYKSNLLGLLLRRFWPMQLVTTVHGWVKQTRRTPFYYKVDQLCLPRYQAVLCVSEDLHAQCLQCGVPSERCQLIENGVDTQEYVRRFDVVTAKRRLGLSPNRFTIGAVGRLSAEKGFDILIRAVHLLLEQGIDLELLIAGSGDAETELRTLISNLKLYDRVRLLGHVADPRSLYEAIDLFALSSYREGLPNVLLEAMALEVPAVATRVNGVPRLVIDDETGMLVESGSASELAKAISFLLRDPTRRADLALAGRRHVVERFSFAARMAKVKAVYDSVLCRN